MEESGVCSDDSEGNDAFIVLKIIGGVGGIDLFINDTSVVFLCDGVICCKDNIIEGVIEGCIEYPESVCCASVELGLYPGEGEAIGGESGPGIALLAEHDESFKDAVG